MASLSSSMAKKGLPYLIGASVAKISRMEFVKLKVQIKNGG